MGESPGRGSQIRRRTAGLLPWVDSGPKLTRGAGPFARATPSTTTGSIPSEEAEFGSAVRAWRIYLKLSKQGLEMVAGGGQAREDVGSVFFHPGIDTGLGLERPGHAKELPPFLAAGLIVLFEQLHRRALTQHL